ncbi:hypothetical protein LTR10_013388 [Elasticomyces elasticus]|uniref:BTB domain-containing protein n=1 Tax=Exophiala sideris TaxID=1016849 RepID=A0ABR0J583_9EURO|nr:hypothetical protein LTR10_013388 [Elasticomyces elasticus]KAK5027382.1 hypothetical protein LTS07_006984 [Exophiala sideris]KAK5034916.1 hypothetical protein LTR13_006098 [Exophiala sideris]KAK5056350.1 hypothetical protein LTR69_007891 [Exophiala sideris]KAK5181161.1 hypothetical protein LTR44_006492 [Eurotiomycetes sp. CCFEE 6388]
MSLIIRFTEAPIEIPARTQGDVFLQIGKVSKGPALQVSSRVLARSFKRFASYNFEGRAAEEPFVFVDETHRGMALLMSIAHGGEEVDPAAIPFEEVKRAAEYARKHGYEPAGQSRNPKWLPLYLRNQLPPDKSFFPEPILCRDPKGCFERIINVLYIAFVFDCSEEFARAGRQLTWILAPTDLTNCMLFGLPHEIQNDFRHAFDNANNALRSELMSELPPVFYPNPHRNEHGPCLKCNLIPHEQRWCRELTLRNASRKDRLAEVPNCDYYDRATGSLWTNFSAMIKDMEEVCKEQAEIAGLLPCGRFRARAFPLSHGEILHNIYLSIGGPCLRCFRDGDGSFKHHCDHVTDENFQLQVWPEVGEV